jgi:hypothetical protein
MALLFPGLMALLLILLIVFVVRFFRKAANFNPIQSIKDKISGWFGGGDSSSSGNTTPLYPTTRPLPGGLLGGQGGSGGTRGTGGGIVNTIRNSPLNPLFPINVLSNATGGRINLNPFRR